MHWPAEAEVKYKIKSELDHVRTAIKNPAVNTDTKGKKIRMVIQRISVLKI